MSTASEARLSKAYETCLNLADSHYENFPVASLAIPKKLRPHVAAVYAFSRTADDFADEPQFEGQRLQKLDEWLAHLHGMQAGEPTHPIFMALKATVEEFKLPLVLFEDLIHAFKTDCQVTRYQTFDQVLGYCRYSANPVGRIILYLFGYPTPQFLAYSDAICTALQLANFWQDVGVDLDKDRIYIPKEDLLRFGVSESALFEKKATDNFRRLLSFEIERTQEYFDDGKPLCGRIPGRLGMELRLTWLGGTSILKKIRKNGFDVFTKRPKLKKTDYIGIVLRALIKRSFLK